MVSLRLLVRVSWVPGRDRQRVRGAESERKTA